MCYIEIVIKNPYTANTSTESERWQDKAECLKTPGPFDSEHASPGQIALAKKVCAKCIVRDECLAYALKNKEQFGIWGGLTEQERKALRRRMQRARRQVA